MAFEAIRNRLPDYAKDIKLNLSALGNEEGLNAQQFWGCAMACAMAGRNAGVIADVEREASSNLSPAALNAAKAAAAIMAMNNVYYKFVGMSASPEYKTMPAKLRMNILADPGVDKADFELWSLAVSAINGCKFCVDAHEKQLETHGTGKPQIQTAVRLAAVIQAASAVLEAQAGMAGALAEAA